MAKGSWLERFGTVVMGVAALTGLWQLSQIYPGTNTGFVATPTPSGVELRSERIEKPCWIQIRAEPRRELRLITKAGTQGKLSKASVEPDGLWEITSGKPEEPMFSWLSGIVIRLESADKKPVELSSWHVYIHELGEDNPSRARWRLAARWGVGLIVLGTGVALYLQTKKPSEPLEAGQILARLIEDQADRPPVARALERIRVGVSPDEALEGLGSSDRLRARGAARRVIDVTDTLKKRLAEQAVTLEAVLGTHRPDPTRSLDVARRPHERGSLDESPARGPNDR